MTNSALFLRVAMGAALLFVARRASGDDACQKKALAAARARFDDLYRATKYQEAFDDLAKTKDLCWASLGTEDRGRFVSDLALAAYRAGKPDVCLQMLAAAPADLAADSKVAKSIAFNRELCASKPATIALSPAASPVAQLCSQKDKVVRIVPKKFEDPPEEPGHETFAKLGADGRESKLMLEARADLNGDGVAELIFDNPDAVARDARFLSWFLDCRNGTFYELLTDYAADYEIDKAVANGWKLLQLYNNMSPEKPSFTIVSKTTYRFDGSRYVLMKSRKVKHRIL